MQSDEPRASFSRTASSARHAMLEAAGLRFETRPAHVDEAAIEESAHAEGASASDTAVLLAELKAARVAMREPDAMVIGADQLLVCEGNWFDKPDSLAAARAQLSALRGKTHVLVTAVLCQRGGSRLWRGSGTPPQNAYILGRLARGVSCGRGRARAGQRRRVQAEGPGIQLFDCIEGDHFSILGLPLLPLLGFLRQHRVLEV